MVNPEKELNTPDDVLTGVQHILAEMIAETADVRGVRPQRALGHRPVLTTSKSEKLAEGQGLEYKDYFEFNEPIRHIPPHRVLAINRGEKENALTVKLEWDSETGQRVALERLPLPLPGEAPTLPPPARRRYSGAECGSRAARRRRPHPPKRRRRKPRRSPAAPLLSRSPRLRRADLSALWAARTEALRSSSARGVSRRRSPRTPWTVCWCRVWNARFAGN